MKASIKLVLASLILILTANVAWAKAPNCPSAQSLKSINYNVAEYHSASDTYIVASNTVIRNDGHDWGAAFTFIKAEDKEEAIKLAEQKKADIVGGGKVALYDKVEEIYTCLYYVQGTNYVVVAARF